jgi:hypothetical protein
MSVSADCRYWSWDAAAAATARCWRRRDMRSWASIARPRRSPMQDTVCRPRGFIARSFRRPGRSNVPASWSRVCHCIISRGRRPRHWSIASTDALPAGRSAVPAQFDQRPSFRRQRSSGARGEFLLRRRPGQALLRPRHHRAAVRARLAHAPQRRRGDRQIRSPQIGLGAGCRALLVIRGGVTSALSVARDPCPGPKIPRPEASG